MPTLTIDGKPCEFDGKKTILQVALENDVPIPHYCYHPGLSIVASCRICLAEVAQPNPRNDNKLELIPKLMPTCQTMAADHMEVYVNSPKSIANQKAVMEYLLINHPLDCPVCDQAGECYLQDYSYQYGRSESRFEEQKIKQPTKDIGPHVKLYSDRCIMCSRCVRFTREVSGDGEISIFGRGNREQIDIFPGVPLDNELSGNVVDICPVGALLDKDFLFSQRVWFLKETPSIDGITASGDNIEVHHNEGAVYRIKPRTNMDVNKWWISDEIRYGWKFVHHEDRLRSPIRKVYGTQEECDWNKAYGEVTEKIKDTIEELGEENVALMISPMLSCEESYLFTKFAAAVDAKATIGIGPVPVDGEDKQFPGGYTVYAEKCPNRRGVERAAKKVVRDLLAYEELLKKIPGAQVVVLCGNYASDWITKDLQAALKGKFVVLIDTLPNAIADSADVILPGATWLEKQGTFENANGRLQTFEQAIPVIELAKPEGQIALDLLAACGKAERSIFDATRVRVEMGEEFVSDVHHAGGESVVEPDMEYVEL